MKFELIYQLNCNKDHTLCFYIEIKSGAASISIYRYKEETAFLFMRKLLPFHPISCGWIGNRIYLLSEKDCFCLNINSGTFMELSLPSYKITDFLYLETAECFLYAAMIDPDYIDFYKKSGLSDDIKIASYYFEQEQLVFENIMILEHEKSLVLEYVHQYQALSKTGSYDEMDGHSLKITHLPLSSKLWIDDKCIREEFGFIDRAFFFGNDIIYTVSSLLFPTSIKWMPLESAGVQPTKEKHDLHYGISVIYNSEDIPNIHHYKVYSAKEQRGIIVMLHGGPADRYSNRFDPLIFSFARNGYAIFLINYTGSTGYGYEYQRTLYGNAGMIDCAEVLNCLHFLKTKYSEKPLYLSGDSYGGYLTILALLKSGELVTKAYAMNAFTDIRHQFLFSCARSVIQKYFPPVCSPMVRDINPIDIVKTGQLKEKLLIINGQNDAYCPKEQIIQFSEISGCSIRLLSDYPHYKVDYAEILRISNMIIHDIEDAEK